MQQSFFPSLARPRQPLEAGVGQAIQPTRRARKKIVASRSQQNPDKAIALQHGSRGPEIQRHAIDAIAQPCRRRTVRKDMAEVRSAPAAMNLGAFHAETTVARCSERAGQRIEETAPTRAALEFLPGSEQRPIATGAMEIARSLLVIEGAAPRPLGAMTAHHMILLRR